MIYRIGERDIIKVCLLYYEENKTQQEISRLMGISRFKVSRLLRQAKKEGFISIVINDPLGDIGEAEIRLAKKYGLKESVVVRSNVLPGKPEPVLIGEAGAQYLLRTIGQVRILAVAWGMTLRQVVNGIDKIETSELTVVQLSGGIGVIGGTDTNMLTMMLSEKLSARPLLLPAPLLVSDPSTRKTFLREGNIAETLDTAKAADMALLGIGLADEKGSLYQAGLLREKDFAAVVRTGAVGALCGRLYDIQGNPCVTDWDRRVIGLTLEEIRRIPHKVGIAAGREKLEAIVGALNGHLLDVLITDEQTAQALLNR